VNAARSITGEAPELKALFLPIRDGVAEEPAFS
jgi:hypothetical protein